MEVEQSAKETFLEIRANEQSIVLPLDAVESVLLIAALQEVPNKHTSFEGVLNYHGHSIPIYSLQKLLNESATPEYTLDTPIVLCQIESQKLGLIVDEAKEVLSFFKNQIQQPSLTESLPYVDGVIEEEEGSFWSLNLTKLMSHHQIETNKQVTNHD